MKRVRFGFKGIIIIAPNATVWVRKVSASDVPKLQMAWEALRIVLQSTGMHEISDKMIFEVQNA